MKCLIEGNKEQIADACRRIVEALDPVDLKELARVRAERAEKKRERLAAQKQLQEQRATLYEAYRVALRNNDIEAKHQFAHALAGRTPITSGLLLNAKSYVVVIGTAKTLSEWDGQ